MEGYTIVLLGLYVYVHGYISHNFQCTNSLMVEVTTPNTLYAYVTGSIPAY